MGQPVTIEFCGGPLDGQQRRLPDLPLVLPVPVPPQWTDDPVTNPNGHPLKEHILYTIRCDDTGTPVTVIEDGDVFQYDFRGYT